MPLPSQYFKIPKASMDEMMREQIARQTEANGRMKNQFEYLKEKSPRTNFLPHTTKPKSRHEVVEGIFKSPSIQNENDKGDVDFIEIAQRISRTQKKRSLSMMYCRIMLVGRSSINLRELELGIEREGNKER
ncbi:hypothetical protein Tco_1555268 [Tanacetum coccineum]